MDTNHVGVQGRIHDSVLHRESGRGSEIQLKGGVRCVQCENESEPVHSTQWKILLASATEDRRMAGESQRNGGCDVIGNDSFENIRVKTPSVPAPAALLNTAPP